MPDRKAAAGVLLLLLMFVGAVGSVAAQTSGPAGGTNRSTWLNYFGDQPFTKTLALHLEGSYRKTLGLTQFEQAMARAGLTVVESKRWQSLVAYSFFLSEPTADGSFGPPPLIGKQQEHRLFEQQIFEHRLFGQGRTQATLSHRVRLEQRWNGTESTGGAIQDWKFSERARYRMTFRLPTGERSYISAFNEVYTGFGPHGGTGPLYANVTYVARGHKLHEHWSIEVGYQFRSLEHAGGTTGVHDHSLQLTLISSKPLREAQ